MKTRASLGATVALIVASIVTAVPSDTSALTNGSVTYAECTVSYGYGYNTWYGYYQNAVSTNDTGCWGVGVRFNNTGTWTKDITHPLSAFTSRASVPCEYNQYMSKESGAKYYYWNGACV